MKEKVTPFEIICSTFAFNYIIIPYHMKEQVDEDVRLLCLQM